VGGRVRGSNAAGNNGRGRRRSHALGLDRVPALTHGSSGYLGDAHVACSARLETTRRESVQEGDGKGGGGRL